MKQGGHLANRSGNTLETTVKATLASKGFEIVRYREWLKKPDKYGDDLVLCNVPFETVYNHKGNTEFLIKSATYDLEVRVECKWQQSSGSVDEKYPYLYLNCVEKMPEQEIIIIVDGGGAKPGAIAWLRVAAENNLYQDEQNPKNIHVMNLSDFLIWVNKTFR